MIGILKQSPEQRAARKAEVARMLAAEAEQTRIRDKRDRVTARGYTAQDGRIDDVGGYGVSLIEDGTVVRAGDPEFGDAVTLPLAGAKASLETLAEARDRVTAGRVLALGVLALAVPKRDRRRVLVLRAVDGTEAAVVADGTDEVHLRQWVAWFNRRSAAAETAE